MISTKRSLEDKVHGIDTGEIVAPDHRRCLSRNHQVRKERKMGGRVPPIIFCFNLLILFGLELHIYVKRHHKKRKDP